MSPRRHAGLRQLRNPVTHLHLVVHLGSVWLVLQSGRLRAGDHAVPELRQLRDADTNVQLGLHMGCLRQLLRAGRVRARPDDLARLWLLRDPVSDLQQQLHLARVRLVHGSTRRLRGGVVHELLDHKLPRGHAVVQQQLPVGNVRCERVLALRSPGRVCAR